MGSLGIIGIGSTIRGDDGIGVLLVERLKTRKLPDGVELYDAGTSGMNILHRLKDFDAAIIVDAIRTEGRIGDWVFFSPQEVDSTIEMRNTHDANILEALELSEMLDERPDEVRIMGIIPGDTSIGEGLSLELENRLPELEEALINEIGELTNAG